MEAGLIPQLVGGLAVGPVGAGVVLAGASQQSALLAQLLPDDE